MKILQVHNVYQQPGGEDQVCAAECELLTARGHQVIPYRVHNDAIQEMSALHVGLKTIWSAETHSKARELIRREQPDVLHAHNTFPLISPAIYYAAEAEGVRVVQTLHNYRLFCPAATFFREGAVCEDCLHSPVPFQAVKHRCYRHSATASATVASMLVAHRVAGTWRRKVNTYIALTNFSRDKFIEGGLPQDRIVVKPNCLATDPGAGVGQGNYALFAGRLTEEKGVCTLIDAWKQFDSPIPLKIAGDGPLANELRERARNLRNIEWLGRCDHDQVLNLMRRAALLITPSLYYENLPMTIIEAFACGTPVIASGLGALNELVRDEENGLRFLPGDPNDLANKVSQLITAPDRLKRMRGAARLCYERYYTPERNYELLMNIYTNAIQNVKVASGSSRFAHGSESGVRSLR